MLMLGPPAQPYTQAGALHLLQECLLTYAFCSDHFSLFLCVANTELCCRTSVKCPVDALQPGHLQPPVVKQCGFAAYCSPGERAHGDRASL